MLQPAVNESLLMSLFRNVRTEADFTALLGADKDKPVVFYCGFVKCTRSDNGATWARKPVYTQVYRVPRGLFAWKGAGYPLEAVE